jgi:hypothetical protein
MAWTPYGWRVLARPICCCSTPSCRTSSGFDVCAELKFEAAFADIPVVFVSSHRDESFEEVARHPPSPVSGCAGHALQTMARAK